MGKAVDFGSLRRLKPLSAHWGFDRGTPIDRFYIEAFLGEHASHVRGAVMEVKSRDYTERFGGDRVESSDVLDLSSDNGDATIVADIMRTDDFAGDRFDCILFTQTLQLIREPARAIRTLRHALKPGGRLLLTCPGITRIATKGAAAEWYWSFTRLSLEMLLNEEFGAENVGCSSNGNVFAATCFLWGISVEEIERAELEYQDPRYPVILSACAIKQ